MRSPIRIFLCHSSEHLALHAFTLRITKQRFLPARYEPERVNFSDERNVTYDHFRHINKIYYTNLARCSTVEVMNTAGTLCLHAPRSAGLEYM